MGKVFEFVLVDAPSLARISRADEDAFHEYFDRCTNDIADFLNLGRDAHLVSPCPKESYNYVDIARFVRSAPASQIEHFWNRVGSIVESTAASQDRKRWLSTSGLGVYYLHVRIDSRPKYYQFLEYKNM